ncbi:hypothetical protein [Geodermatophilus sp. DSM 44513]|uniref:hypothetical protein n=1 Tax=Geodermatophilus sp. DSM 44513 TaxID=1528104 RepID=UPI00126B1AE9|nr:hypothetical protein [Geodermatophilus sp. DSM 44513]WNV74810.1 hypothetical protein RTG05_17700 [Geodermatophilus sp. DSM 44513]
MEPFGQHPFTDPSRGHDYGIVPPVFANPNDHVLEHEWHAANDTLERQLRTSRQATGTTTGASPAPYEPNPFPPPPSATAWLLGQARQRLTEQPVTPDDRSAAARVINELPAASVRANREAVRDLLHLLGDRSDLDARMEWNTHVVAVRVGLEEARPPARPPSVPLQEKRGWWSRLTGRSTT